MKREVLLFLKGMAMGIANIIPGVSGGTIALITEIYEELLNSLKSLDFKAIKLLFSLKFKEFFEYTNFYFLLSVFGGSIVSLFSVASLFEYLFKYYPTYVWAFFFGLIIASVFFVGKRITRWNLTNIFMIFLGTFIAIGISFLTPASENDNLLFVFVCGIIGVSGMMLPGLSGSFILILMGNYKLLMVTAVTELNASLLSVFLAGSVFGLLSFSHILSWVLKRYKNATLALLTGFILGSLNIIWPWKKELKTSTFEEGSIVLEYERYLPSIFNLETFVSISLIVAGILIIFWIESFKIKGNT